MTTRTGNFSHLLAPGLRKVFFDYFKGLPTEYDKIAKMGTSKRNYEDDLEVSMLGGSFPEKDEGVSIDYVDPSQGNTKRYSHKTFGLGFRVTWEMLEDDLYAVMNKMSRGLAKAARNGTELQFWGMIDDAFTGATYTGFDGHRLCYASHVVLFTGATFANTPTTQVDIGISSLQAAVLNIEKQPDSDGVIAGMKPWRVVIAPDNKFIMRELLGSAQKPYTAGNEINALMDEDLSYFVNHYQSDTDAWLLLAKEHDLNFIWRRKTFFENGDDFDTGDAKFKAVHRHSQGFGAPQGVYGSSGG